MFEVLVPTWGESREVVSERGGVQEGSRRVPRVESRLTMTGEVEEEVGVRVWWKWSEWEKEEEGYGQIANAMHQSQCCLTTMSRGMWEEWER